MKPNIKFIIQNVLGVESETDINIDRVSKIFVNNVMSITGILYSLFFGIFNIKNNDLHLATINFMGSCFFLAAYTYQKKTQNHKTVSFFNCILITGIFITILFNGGRENTSYLWSLLYPFIAIVLLSYKIGTVCAGLYLFIFTYALFNPIYNDISNITKSRLVGIYILIYMFTFFYEYIRSQIKYKVMDHNNDLNTNLKKQVEIKQQLEQSNALQQSIANSIKEIAIFSIDSSFNYIYCNEKYLQNIKNITGNTISLGDSIFDYIINREEKEVIKKHLSKVSNGEHFITQSELSLGDKIIYTENIYSPIKNLKNSFIGMTVVEVDITKRKMDQEKFASMEKELVQAQKFEAIGSLAAGIAHEINTPIQFIGNNTFFIEKGIKKLIEMTSTYKELIVANCKSACQEIIQEKEKKLKIDYLIKELPIAISQNHDGVARVSKIVGAMKSFSHMDGDEKVLTDINKIIDTTTIITKNEWKYIAELTSDLNENIPHILCFSDEISQVIVNLIVNASHAIEDSLKNKDQEKGKINITSNYDTKNVYIRVKDSGSGIPEKIQNKVFDHFFTTKEVGKGTGQGLSLAYMSVVEKHDGRIYFNSEEGKGTTFTIELPINCE